jgi:hypothetical protein
MELDPSGLDTAGRLQQPSVPVLTRSEAEGRSVLALNRGEATAREITIPCDNGMETASVAKKRFLHQETPSNRRVLLPPPIKPSAVPIIPLTNEELMWEGRDTLPGTAPVQTTMVRELEVIGCWFLCGAKTVPSSQAKKVKCYEDDNREDLADVITSKYAHPLLPWELYLDQPTEDIDSIKDMMMKNSAFVDSHKPVLRLKGLSKRILGFIASDIFVWDRYLLSRQSRNWMLLQRDFERYCRQTDRSVNIEPTVHTNEITGRTSMMQWEEDQDTSLISLQSETRSVHADLKAAYGIELEIPAKDLLFNEFMTALSTRTMLTATELMDVAYQVHRNSSASKNIYGMADEVVSRLSDLNSKNVWYFSLGALEAFKRFVPVNSVDNIEGAVNVLSQRLRVNPSALLKQVVTSGRCMDLQTLVSAVDLHMQTDRSCSFEDLYYQLNCRYERLDNAFAVAAMYSAYLMTSRRTEIAEPSHDMLIDEIESLLGHQSNSQRLFDAEPPAKIEADHSSASMTPLFASTSTSVVSLHVETPVKVSDIDYVNVLIDTQKDMSCATTDCRDDSITNTARVALNQRRRIQNCLRKRRQRASHKIADENNASKHTTGN